jgi:hypothetical protein
MQSFDCISNLILFAMLEDFKHGYVKLMIFF